MRRVMRHLGNNPAFQEFDPVILREDAGFDHAVVLLDREPVDREGRHPARDALINCCRGHERTRPLSPSTVSRRLFPRVYQCPMYFAYSVRALSTSLVPLMIARPSGNTVNSWPSAVNLSRKRL